MSLKVTARALLLAGGALLPTIVYAQDVATVPPAVAAADQTAAGAKPAAPDTGPATSDIVVTGTRIRRPDFQAPNPIVSLNATNIQQSA